MEATATLNPSAMNLQLFAVNVEKSSFESGLDERRLMLTLDCVGTVLEVRAGDNHWYNH